MPQKLRSEEQGYENVSYENVGNCNRSHDVIFGETLRTTTVHKWLQRIYTISEKPARL